MTVPARGWKKGSFRQNDPFVAIAGCDGGGKGGGREQTRLDGVDGVAGNDILIGGAGWDIGYADAPRERLNSVEDLWIF